jgi:hypothetical protein
MENHINKPYATDFFHEQKPLMKAIMSEKGILDRISHFIQSLPHTKHLFLGYSTEDRPKIRVTGVEIIVQPVIAQMFSGAMRSMVDSGITVGIAGHGSYVTDQITKGGYKPEIGQYHQIKGHGALGRGSYFSDRVDKAVSYAGNDPGARGQIIISNLLMGNAHEVTSGKPLRHETHNQMVRSQRSGVNKRRDEGTENLDLSANDSIVGRESYESGGSAITAWRYKNEFDSNETLLRNADQILPQFVIHYEVESPPASNNFFKSMLVLGAGAVIALMIKNQFEL